MTRKCRKIQHIMDMARAALTVGASTSSATTARKRRKLDADEHLPFSAGSSIVQINIRSPVNGLPETTILPPQEARCSSLHTDEFPDSCCSSKGSANESIGFLDLEVESAQVETSTCNCSGDESRRDKNLTSELRTRTKSEEMESSAAENPKKEKLITEVNSHRKPTGRKRPTEMELEEFFGAAEKEIQKRFVKKYNYDIVNDVPLEGRYEWVKLKP